MERYVTTTYRLHEFKCNEQKYEFIGLYLYSLSIYRVSVLLDGPGLSFVG